MRGGNIQLSRAFAEFAQVDPERAIRLMEQFEPRQQERAAGYALDAMAGDASNDTRIISALFDLDARGFQAEEFRESAAHAIEKIASRKADIDEAIVEILVSWLKVATLSIEEGEEEEDVELTLGANEEGLSERSILWGRSEEHTSELQSLMRISYAVFCLKKKKQTYTHSYQK